MSSQKTAEEIKSKLIESLTTLLDDNLNEPLEELYKNINESEIEIDELIDPEWKSGLTKLQVDKYSKKILHIFKYDEHIIPSIPSIIDDQNMSLENKGKAIQLFDTLQMHSKFTSEYDAVKRKLISLTNSNAQQYPSLTEEEQEKQGKKERQISCGRGAFNRHPQELRCGMRCRGDSSGHRVLGQVYEGRRLGCGR